MKEFEAEFRRMIFLKMTFRWYGDDDKVTLDHIRQIPGVTGIVSAIYDVPVGEVWPLEKILALKEKVEAKGLKLETIESIPVHEDIKMGLPSRDRLIANYCESVKNCAKAGIKVVCYNFMPVFDWTRSELAHELPDGSNALIYKHDTVLKMDPLTRGAFAAGLGFKLYEGRHERPSRTVQENFRRRFVEQPSVFS